MKQINYFTIGILLITLFTSCNRGAEIKLYPVKIGDKYQYIDKEGKIVINPQFSEASLFSDNGLALVKSSGENPLYGYINEDGQYAIMPKYKYAADFTEGLAWVVAENEPPKAINSKGEIKIVLKDAEEVGSFNEGFAAFCIVENREFKYGFVDKDGKIKINPQFIVVDEFSSGKCGVENKEGKWGYINKEGKLVINYQFDAAAGFHKNGIACVKLGDKWGVIDENGKYIINPQFSAIGYDGDDMFLIEQDGKRGWCNKNGKIIINPQFESSHIFNNSNLAPVKLGATWGYIGKDGKLAINPQFDDALRFNGSIAIVKSGDKYGFIDKEGKFVINPQYDDINLNDNKHIRTDYFNAEAVITFNKNLTYGSVTDIDGNIYKTITIGTQTWMAENLRTTKYRNGVAIPNVTDSIAWTTLTTGAWCNFNNDASNVQKKYVKLYNWYAATDSRNIAPTGWHVPSDAEWSTLTTYLGGEAVAGGKLKETGTFNWESPNTGATNETGFSALPGGYRDNGSGTFVDVGGNGYWWSSTEGNTYDAWYRGVGNDSSSVDRSYLYKQIGFSVRCVRDN